MLRLYQPSSPEVCVGHEVKRPKHDWQVIQSVLVQMHTAGLQRHLSFHLVSWWFCVIATAWLFMLCVRQYFYMQASTHDCLSYSVCMCVYMSVCVGLSVLTQL